MTTQSYLERQQEQLQRYQEWVKVSGGVEGIVLFTTIMQPHQRERLDWIKSQVVGTSLEIGCNWGYVTGWIGGDAGVDISPGPIELARLLMPDKDWRVGDATELSYPAKSFDTVLLTEVLEHLEYPRAVHAALHEGLRVARKRLVITMPHGEIASADATNLKHRWLMTDDRLQSLVTWLATHGSSVTYDVHGGFVRMVVTV